jgi:hypothetical protein
VDDCPRMYGDARMGSLGCGCVSGQSTCIHKSGHRTSLSIILPRLGVHCSALSPLVDWLARLAGPPLNDPRSSDLLFSHSLSFLIFLLGPGLPACLCLPCCSCCSVAGSSCRSATHALAAKPEAEPGERSERANKEENAFVWSSERTQQTKEGQNEVKTDEGRGEKRH